MARTLNIHNQRGFTLIEALFSSIVLGIGLLALAGFHAVALQDGTAIKMRMVATNLAQEKLDDLKSFIRLYDDTTVDENGDGINNNDCGNGIFCYTEIATGSATSPYGGGHENSDGTLKLPYGAISPPISGTTYTRKWTVVCYSEGLGAAPVVNADCSDADFKRVTVRIEWQDNKGVDQFAELQSVIYGFDPTKITRATAGFEPSPGPKVSYTPVGVPDAVPVEVGDSEYKESSKPVPDISTFGDSTLVTFDTTAYTTPGNSIDSREEFITLSCTCEFVGSGQGRTPTRMVWAGYQLEPEIGVMVTKTTGRKPTTGQAAQQPALCDTCCRDHHDVSGTSYPKYDTKRYVDNSEDVHKHYMPDVSGVLQEVTSGQYLESCRFKRINGLWYVMQDWRMVDMVTMPKDNYLEVEASLTSYQNYLQRAMAYHGLGNGSAPDKATLANRNIIQLGDGDESQVLTRALFVDPIYQCRPGAYTVFSKQLCPAGKNPTSLDTDYVTKVLAIKTANEATPPDTTDNWRKHVPFYEINLTLLATWASSDTTRVTVDNEPITDILDPDTSYYESYHRGRVHAGTTAGTATITATSRRSNTGITSGVKSAAGNVDGFGIDLHDDANTLSDGITVTRLSGAATNAINGEFRWYGSGSLSPKPTSLTVTASPSAGVTCTYSGSINSRNLSYSCTVQNNWSGTITPSATSAGGGGNDAAGTTYYFYPASRTYTNVTAPIPNQHYKFCKDSSLCVP